VCVGGGNPDKDVEDKTKISEFDFFSLSFYFAGRGHL